MYKKILILAPHPDDEIIGIGGTIIKNIQMGNQVFVAIVTKGYSPLFDENLIIKTRKEAMAVHKSIGVAKTFFLDFPSTMLDTVPKHELNSSIYGIVKEVNPDEVYIPFDKDMHFDHGIVCEAGLVATRSKYSFAPSTIYIYETLSETGWNLPRANSEFMPNVFVDISQQLESKLNALSVYASQVEEFPAARSIEAVKSLAMYRGALVNVDAAEAFMLVREVK